MRQLLQIIPNLAGCPPGSNSIPIIFSWINTLDRSGLGARICEVFCGAPMYADDLPLVASSPEELQAMPDIVLHYAPSGITS